MSGDSPDIETRRKRAHFRAWHRGMREADLIVGRFADASLGGMGADELAQFERLLDVPDADIVRWVTGERAVPAEQDFEMLRRVIAWRESSELRN